MTRRSPPPAPDAPTLPLPEAGPLRLHPGWLGVAATGSFLVGLGGGLVIRTAMARDDRTLAPHVARVEAPKPLEPAPPPPPPVVTTPEDEPRAPPSFAKPAAPPVAEPAPAPSAPTPAPTSPAPTPPVAEPVAPPPVDDAHAPAQPAREDENAHDELIASRRRPFRERLLALKRLSGRPGPLGQAARAELAAIDAAMQQSASTRDELVAALATHDGPRAQAAGEKLEAALAAVHEPRPEEPERVLEIARRVVPLLGLLEREMTERHPKLAWAPLPLEDVLRECVLGWPQPPEGMRVVASLAAAAARRPLPASLVARNEAAVEIGRALGLERAEVKEDELLAAVERARKEPLLKADRAMFLRGIERKYPASSALFWVRAEREALEALSRLRDAVKVSLDNRGPIAPSKLADAQKAVSAPGISDAIRPELEQVSGKLEQSSQLVNVLADAWMQQDPKRKRVTFQSAALPRILADLCASEDEPSGEVRVAATLMAAAERKPVFRPLSAEGPGVNALLALLGLEAPKVVDAPAAEPDEDPSSSPYPQKPDKPGGYGKPGKPWKPGK